MVFSVDRFELVAEKDLELSRRRYDELNEQPWIGTVQVFARLPDDPEEASRFMDVAIFGIQPDLERRPEYWHPYADNAVQAGRIAHDIELLLSEDAGTAARASALIDKYLPDHARPGYLPLLGRSSDYAMILDRDTGRQLEISGIDPYELMGYRESQAGR